MMLASLPLLTSSDSWLCYWWLGQYACRLHGGWLDDQMVCSLVNTLGVTGRFSDCRLLGLSSAIPYSLLLHCELIEAIPEIRVL